METDLPWVHGGDLVARQLEVLGCDHLFTLTGGHISAIYDGMRFTSTRIVDFRHEQAAVHCADAMSRLTRRPSVAALTAGPGVTGGVTALANAYYAGSPVIALGGRNPVLTDGMGNIQEAPHVELLSPVTRYARLVTDAVRLPDIIHEAYVHASGPPRGPAFVDIPMDVQLSKFGADDAPLSRACPDIAERAPATADVDDVVTRLEAAKRPVFLCGSGAYWNDAGDAVRAFCENHGIPVFVNGIARGFLGPDCSVQIFRNRRKALYSSDLVVLLGADMDFRLGFGQAGSFGPETAIVQVHEDRSRLCWNRDVDRAVHSDTAAFVRALGDASPTIPPEVAPWLAALRDGDASSADALDAAREMTSGKYVHPMRFVSEICRRLPERSIVIGDGGDIVALFAKYYRPSGPGRWMDPGPFGCLGIGAPFAMAARLHDPGAQVVVIYGDGSFGFNAMEFEAAARQKLPFVGIIGNDGAWGEMRTFHEDVFGKEDLSAQFLSQETRYERVVEGLGGVGIRVETPEELGPALDRAFQLDVPVLVNVLLDPDCRQVNATVSGAFVAQSFGGAPDAYRR